MLVGLFRQRGDGIGMVGLIWVLWRQVILVLASRGSLNPADIFHFGKGIIWLLLAMATEVPPMVNLKSNTFLVRLLVVNSTFIPGIHYFELKRYSSECDSLRISIESYPSLNISSVRLSRFYFFTTV